MHPVTIAALPTAAMSLRVALGLSAVASRAPWALGLTSLWCVAALLRDTSSRPPLGLAAAHPARPPRVPRFHSPSTQRPSSPPLPLPPPTTPHLLQSKATTLGRVMTPANVSFTALSPGELVTGVEWAANTRWWGAASLPQPPVGRVLTPTNLNSSAVRAGLLAGTIHAAVGAATLSPTDFAALRASSGTPGAPTALISMPLQTRVLLLNSNASAPAAMGATGLPVPGPMASLAVRRAVNKALDKAALVVALGGLEAAADRLFSTDTPFSNTSIGALPVFDAAGARTLLEQDGWVVPTGATFRARAGVQLAGELTYVANDASAAAIGEHDAPPPPCWRDCAPFSPPTNSPSPPPCHPPTHPPTHTNTLCSPCHCCKPHRNWLQPDRHCFEQDCIPEPQLCWAI